MVKDHMSVPTAVKNVVTSVETTSNHLLMWSERSDLNPHSGRIGAVPTWSLHVFVAKLLATVGV